MRLAEMYKVPAGDDNCPADKMMFLYRTNPSLLARKAYYSESSIDFFKAKSDAWQRIGTIYLFSWEAIMDQGLPPLTVKVQKEGKRYKLLYLKEKVNYSDRVENFPGRSTLLINRATLSSMRPGEIYLNKEESREEKKK